MDHVESGRFDLRLEGLVAELCDPESAGELSAVGPRVDEQDGDRQCLEKAHPENRPQEREARRRVTCQRNVRLGRCIRCGWVF